MKRLVAFLAVVLVALIALLVWQLRGDDGPGPRAHAGDPADRAVAGPALALKPTDARGNAGPLYASPWF
jgi:hypothetical protein